MYSSGVRVDDIDKGGLQASTANEETVNVSLLGQLRAILLRHTTTVEDAGLLSSLRGNFLLQPVTDSSVDFLRLLGGSDLASANGPGILLDEINLS
jgi:hypothetical protein